MDPAAVPGVTAAPALRGRSGSPPNPSTPTTIAPPPSPPWSPPFAAPSPNPPPPPPPPPPPSPHPPLLRLDSCSDRAEGAPTRAPLSDARVRRAVPAGSPPPAGARDRPAQAPPPRRDADRMHAKLLRSQIRMATRPTPFGLFAGVA